MVAKTKQQKDSNLPVAWDEELAKQAAISSAMEESTATGQFFGLKGGQLTWQDNPVRDNQMAVIVIDSILENVFYEGKYDPDSPQGPTCFAFGRDEKTLTPHKVVWEAAQQQCGASKLCDGCQWNEWGSADTGRGKACRNTRRLALVHAGSFDAQGRLNLIEDPDHFLTSPIGYMRLPVTSVKGYAGFVKQLAAGLHRPPHGVVTKVKVVPDAKNQFKVLFEPLINVPNALMGAVMKRHEEAMGLIEFPYSLDDFEDEGKKPATKTAKAAINKARRKY